MAERTKTSSSSAPASRPVPMKLFATWEVDRTPSNCIPRLCTLTLTRLVTLRPLGPDLTSISVAVKMQSSKRTLRSNEMSVPPGGMLSTELELQFALQYPHFLKRDGNKLLVLLQRRKRYKNRTMLGYKTLAEGAINMAQVLQRQMDLELELVSDKAEKYGGHALARVNVVALCSQPVDQDKRLMNDANERLCQEFSDEEEEFSSEAEAEGSDSEPTLEMHRRKSRGKMPGNARVFKRHRKKFFIRKLAIKQRNLKQKFISLLKRFRVSEELEHDQEEIGQKLSGGDMEIEELFDELEDLSDSGPELDNMSVNSTPKPSLRPFFSSSRRLLAPPNSERGVDRQSDDSSRRADSDSHPDNWTDHEANDPANNHHQQQQQQQQLAGSPPKSANEQQQNQHQSNAAKDGKAEGNDRKSRLFARDRSSPGVNKIKKHSLSVDLKPPGELNSAEPRKALVEQLARVLPDDVLPDSVALVSLGDPGGPVLAARLQERNMRVLTTASPADVRATFTCLIARLQKYCNSCAKPPNPVKVVVAGGDGYVNTVLRHYVELLSFRPPDWQGYLRFHVVPLGCCNGLARYLGSIDTSYALLFGGEEWRELVEREGNQASESVARISEYLATSASTLPLPIAEAMVTYRETDDSSQTFVPFINDVRVGCHESSTSASVDLEEGGGGGASNAGLGGVSGASAPGAGLAGPGNSTISPPSLPPPTAGSLPLGGGGPAIPIGGRLTPPSSPNVGQPSSIGGRTIGGNAATGVVTTSTTGGGGSAATDACWEPVELQLDYWGRPSLGEKVKNSLRQAFKVLHVQRLPPPGEPPGQSLLCMNYTTKEKKQKIMRLGKKKEKEKENEPKSQQVDGVTRLICSAKTHNIPLRVSIDGTEWYGVKFFQLSAQWQTHIKTFPVAMLAYNNSQQSPNYS